uniref:Uncharacterized protein n=1 Tax=Panagrolaimus superbus TaxID=310955 RepID=A0A914Y6D6_9BILA
MFLDAFAKSMNAKEIRELTQIIDDKSLTKQQTHDQVKALCERSGPESVKKFEETDKIIKGIAEYVMNHVKKIEGKLSPEALEFIKEAKQIYENMEITHTQEEEKLKELANNAPAPLKKELKSNNIFAHLF